MSNRSVSTAVAFARKGFDEAWAEAVAAGEAALAEAAAREAYLCCMPILDCRQGVSEYVGCIAYALQHGILTAQQTRPLLYAAQMALAALGGKDHASK